MSKVDIKRLDSVTKNDTAATEQINDNFKALQAAIENTVSRDGTVPNYMDADLDLNSYRIINAAAPVEGKDVVTLEYFEEKAGGAVEAAAEASASASKAASSAQSALVASNNAIGQLAQAEGLLTATKQFVDIAKEDINTAVDEAAMHVSDIVSDAEGSITNIAVTEANKAIANAAQEATDTATANVNSYVDGTVKPSLQTYVDQAQADANSAATSMEQAALSATAASNYASNASADADNAAESATHAATSASDSEHYSEDSRKWAEGTDEEVQGLGGVHSSKVWADRAEQAAAKAEASTQGGFYNRVHDCILENPNRIYYKIDGSTLTFKAGTKIWYPDGRSVVLENDISGTRTKTSNIVWIDLVNNALIFDDQNIHGPFLDSSYFYSGRYYYSSTENKFQYCETDDVLTGDYPVPLPVIYAKGDISLGIDISNGIICNYYNWFNAVTVFVPAGIKVLFAKGLKEDGSFNNTQYITEAIFNYKGKNTFNYVALKEDGTIIWSGRGFSITDDNFLKNLDTGEIFSGIRLGGAYNDSPSTGYINGVLDLQNPTKLVYWDA